MTKTTQITSPIEPPAEATNYAYEQDIAPDRTAWSMYRDVPDEHRLVIVGKVDTYTLDFVPMELQEPIELKDYASEHMDEMKRLER